MRKSVRIVSRIVAILFGAVAAVIVLAALIANTDFGRRNIASLIGVATSGRVSVEGLSGRIPDRLHVRHFELRDAQALWLTADDVSLDWNPLALLRDRFAISRVEA